MFWLILGELSLYVLPAAIGIKIKDENKVSKYGFLFTLGQIMYLVIALYYLLKVSNLITMFNFSKATILIVSTEYYATDYIKYIKNKDDIILAQKTLKNVLINHFIFIILMSALLYFENKLVC
ncbi:MAG: hypothetical protein VB119_09890 [Candidatus Metalachnospira sp.]|nr:hypothetical protein [Bacteroidaceae bacterium]MEA4973465.1 hypothetical protein [Candidatus Metalachnospira sp.]